MAKITVKVWENVGSLMPNNSKKTNDVTFYELKGKDTQQNIFFNDKWKNIFSCVAWHL